MSYDDTTDGNDLLDGDWVEPRKLAYYRRLEAEDRKRKGAGTDDGASRRQPIDYSTEEDPRVVAARRAREHVAAGGTQADALAVTADTILAAAARGDKRVVLPGGVRQAFADE